MVTNSATCTTYCTQEWGQYCWYTDPEHTQNEVCGSWEIIGETCWQECVNDPEPEPNPEVPEPGGTTTLNPLKRTYCDGMTDAHRQTVATQLEAYANNPNRCADKYVNSFLVGKGVSLGMCLAPGIPGNAQYNAITKNINFATEFALGFPDMYTHEIFHAFQDQVYDGGIKNSPKGQKGHVNVEFEQRVYSDLVNGWPSAYPNSTVEQLFEYAKFIGLVQSWEQNGDYIKMDPNGSVLEKSRWNEFSAMYMKALKIFNEIPNNPYTSEIDLNLKPLALAKALKNGSKINCK